MKPRLSILVLAVFSCFAKIAIPAALAATAQTDGFAVIQKALTGQTLTVKAPGIHAATRVLVRPIDNRISGGTVQPRGLDLLRGSTDVVLSPGTSVTVVKVEESADSRNDILRVGVNVPGGGYASIAFLTGKGSLATLSSAQLVALVLPVLDGSALEALASGSEPPAANPAPAAENAPPPPTAPAHPANTLVDLPPGASGYPPLHASQAAPEGCWWVPWVSEKYKLEFLTQRCAAGSESFGSKYVFFDDERGIGARDSQAKEPLHAFDVLEKPAAEPIAATIRQKFIAKVKDASARQNCAARRTANQTGPVETYEIGPNPAYARQARFNKGDDSEEPCPGLASDDVFARTFVYVPSDTRAKYVRYESQDLWPLDLASIRFFPSSGETGPGAETQSEASARPAAHGETRASARITEEPDATPRPGQWVHAKKINIHDVSGDAAAAASLSFLTGAAPQTATFFLGCNGSSPGGPKVELRAVFPTTPGYEAGSTGSYGSLLLSGGHRDITYSNIGTGKMTYLVTTLSNEDLATLSFEDEAEKGALSILFGAGFAKATVTADLPPDNDALDEVIRACHVSLPPRPPKPFAALAPGQVTHLELAKVALGMTADEVRAALGSQYQYTAQTDPRFASLSFLGAWASDTAYSATLIDGKVAGFNYVHVFSAGAQPLQSNLVDGITAKAWSPIFNRPPYRVIWVADAQGNPKLKPRPDVSIHPCAGVSTAAFGAPPRGVSPDARPAKLLQRVLPRDNGSDCGVTIDLNMQPAEANNGTAKEVILTAANDIAFHDFMATVNAANQQQHKAEHDKLNSVPTPF